MISFPITRIHCVMCGGLDGSHALRDCTSLLRRRAARGSAESGSAHADAMRPRGQNLTFVADRKVHRNVFGDALPASALLRTVGAEKEKGERGMSTSSTDIFADERSRVIDLAQYVFDKAKADSERYQRQEEATEVARRLYRGDYHVTENRVASETNPMGLDPQSLPICALRCGERWYAGGRVVGWWNRHGGYQAAHFACWKFSVTLGVPPTSGGAA